MELKAGWLRDDVQQCAQRVKDMPLEPRALAVLRALANTPWQEWHSRRDLHAQFQEFK